MKKFLSKVKALAKRGKLAVVAAVATVSSAAISVCASAATTEASGGSDMKTLLSEAGTQLQNSFSDLVLTLIPVIMGIFGSALVIFGIFALYKLGRRIFCKVAG